MRRKALLQAIWDGVGIPFRLMLIDQMWLPYFGWTTLEEERVAVVLPFVRGRLLDIGAGPNTRVKQHGKDGEMGVYDWGGVPT